MIESLTQFLQALAEPLRSIGVPPFIQLLLSCILMFCFVSAKDELANDAWRKKLESRLRDKSNVPAYRRVLQPRARMIKSALRPKVRSENTGWCDFHVRCKREAVRVSKNPLGWTLLDAALLIAVLYPSLLLLGQWTIFGVGRLGPIEVLSAWTDWREPFSIWLLLLSLLLRSNLQRWLEKSRYEPLQAWAPIISWIPAILAVQTALILAYSILFQGIEANSLGFALAVAIAYIGAAAFAVSFPLAFGAKFFLTGAAAATFAMAFAVAFAVSVAIATYSNDMVIEFAVLAGVVSFSGASVATVGLAFLINSTNAQLVQRGCAWLGYAALLVLCLVVLLAVSTFMPKAGWTQQSVALFLFMGVFSLINGLFDFLSFAGTLFLFRIGLADNRWPAWLCGLGDLLIALILFTLLGVVLISVIAVINMLAPAPLMPLAPIFEDLTAPMPAGTTWLDSPRADYLWLYAMLFSTLLPTLFHASLSCASLYSWTPRLWRLWFANKVSTNQDSVLKANWVAALLGLAKFLTFVLPFAGLALLVWMAFAHAPLAASTYLQVFRLVAIWFGELDELGPGYIPSSWAGIEA